MTEAKAVAEKFIAGERVDRDTGIAALGARYDIAWWDMILLSDAATTAALEPGEMVGCVPTDIPREVWASHRADHGRKEGGHGLVLADAPEAMGTFRYPDGRYGVVVGYRAV